MKRVVIIDDSDINLTLLSTLVQKLGICIALLSGPRAAYCTDLDDHCKR